MSVPAAAIAPGDPTASLSRAFGEPAVRGIIKSHAGDFRVDEIPSVQPDGKGEHLLLRVEKIGANTEWVAGQIARALGIRPRDVGYAGRKDRHALTTQWFSAWLPGMEPAGWQARLPGEVRVLEQHRHGRKLRVGALLGNRFCIRVREVAGAAGLLEARVRHVAAEGVPNYFGTQRFGHDGANLALARKMFASRRYRVSARKRGIVLSAARGFLFNAVLERRVAEHSWNCLLAGDVANLDGNRSVFPVPEVDDALRERVVQKDLHPTGPMWGRGSLMSAGAVAGLEKEIAERHADFARGLEAAGLTQARRPLRMRVLNLELGQDGDDAEIRFDLPAGGFATSVMRELLEWEDGSERHSGTAGQVRGQAAPDSGQRLLSKT